MVPLIAKYCRTFVVSTVFLKLMGMAKVEHNADHECDALQFDFIEKRGTIIAILRTSNRMHTRGQ